MESVAPAAKYNLHLCVTKKKGEYNNNNYTTSCLKVVLPDENICCCCCYVRMEGEAGDRSNTLTKEALVVADLVELLAVKIHNQYLLVLRTAAHDHIGEK